MVDTNDEKDLPYNHNRARWAVLLLAIAAITVLCIIFGYHWDRFGDHLKKDSTGIADWGTFGDFIGGMANPILSCLTIVLLAYTLILQSRQLSISSEELRLSRRELELTRAELKRTAEAQELSEKALREQAEAADISTKLAAINSLLEFYNTELKRNQGLGYETSHPLYEQFERYRARRRILEERLEQFYEDLL